MDSHRRILHEIAIPQAIEKAQKEGLKIGQVVARVGEELSYSVKEVRGSIAIVWLGNEGTEKEFPLSETFDPNDASNFALDELVRQTVPEIQNLQNN